MLRSEIDKAGTLGQFTISPTDPGESTIMVQYKLCVCRSL